MSPHDSTGVNLYLIGAPKCGTSSLFRWLCQHPDIVGSNPKETFFLMDQDNPMMNQSLNVHKDGLAAHLRFFPSNCLERYKYRLEASTHYLYQDTALRVCSQQTGLVRCVVLLRDPIEKIYSSFRYTQNNLAYIDATLSFDQYIEELFKNRCEDIRDKFANVRAHYVFSNMLSYCQYIDHLAKWHSSLGPGKLVVLMFDDLKKDPRMVCRQLADTLEIDSQPFEKVDFRVQNATIAIRNKQLHRRLKQFASAANAIPGLKLAKSLYFRWQRPAVGDHQAALAISDGTVNRLASHFAEYNRRLSDAFCVDCTSWTKAATFDHDCMVQSCR